jgi:hypothetical protein
MNSAATNMGVQVSLLFPDLHSFRYIPMSGTAGSYDSSIFRFLRRLLLFSIAVVLIYIATREVPSFPPTPTSSPFIVVCGSYLDGSYSKVSEVES